MKTQTNETRKETIHHMYSSLLYLTRQYYL